MRVLIADDEANVRAALRCVLEQDPNVTSVAETSGVTYLPDQVRQAQPRVLLLDGELPGLTMRTLLPSLRLADPQLTVVVLSGRPEHRDYMLAEGADAFVCKGDSPEALLSVLRTLGFREDGLVS